MVTGESEKVQEFGEERKVAEAGTAYSTLQVQGTSCWLYAATIRLLVGRNSTMTIFCQVSKNMFILIFLEDMENDSQVLFWLLSMNNTNLLNWYILLLRLSRKVSFILEVDVSFDKTVCLRKICDPSYHIESLSSRRDSKENPPGYRQKPPSVKKLTAAPMKSSSQRVDRDSHCYVGLGRLYYPLSLIEHLT